MRRLLLILTLAALTLCAASVFSSPVALASIVQQHLIGEVTAIDQTTGQITIKTDAGSSTTISTDERTTFRRIPPGQTSLENAERITRTDVSAGDRVLVPNGATLGQSAARQVVVMARAAIASRREQERDEWRRRGINGRVVAVDAAKQEISVETRGREGAETLIVSTGSGVRFKRYAPGSLRPADAVAGTFADIRVGDQVRVLGERDAANTRVRAEEVISGSIARLAGTVEQVDAARGEVVIRSGQNNQLITVALVRNSTLRRIPAEFAERFNQQRQQRRERREAAGDAAGGGQQSGERRRQEGRSQDAQGGERQRRGGGGFQQMFENLPAITAAELKKGDAVIVTGTAGADAAHMTAATLLTGSAEIVQRMQNFQRGPGGQRNMSPGLPGDALGGGPGNRDQP